MARVGQPARQQISTRRALEASIHIGLTVLLVTACLLILRPFIPLIAWGIIIAVALYPGFRRLQHLVGGHGVPAAVLCNLVLLAIVIVPAVLLGEKPGRCNPGCDFQDESGTAIIPPPPRDVENWPVIGPSLKSSWGLASKDLTEVIRRFAPQIKAALPGLLSASAGVGLAVLQLLLSVLVSGVLLANAPAACEVMRSFFNRLFGDQGAEFLHLVGSTIRSVTFGILGVALVQSAFPAVGFFAVGIPGASVWSGIFLCAAVLQVGGVVLIPVIIHVFALESTTTAVIFLIWCVIVGVMDNILKPLLLGRGVAVPIAVVFLGAKGGFVAMGIIGLFVGASVLSVGYKLFLAWLGGRAGTIQAME